MAVACTNITSNFDEDGGSGSTTASVTLVAGRLYLLTVTQRRGDSTDPVEPTISSTGATWVKVNTVVFDSTSSSRRRVTVFRTMVSSNQTGTITITYGSNVSDAIWILDEFTGVDTTGTNGSGATVQSATNKNEAGATSLTVTLAAFGSTNNATYGAFGWDGITSVPTVGSGFTLKVNQNDSGTDLSSLTEFRSDNDTSVDSSYSPAAGLIGGIAIEIKAAATTSIKTILGLAKASVKTVNGLAIASVKTVNGLA